MARDWASSRSSRAFCKSEEISELKNTNRFGHEGKEIFVNKAPDNVIHGTPSDKRQLLVLFQKFVVSWTLGRTNPKKKEGTERVLIKQTTLRENHLTDLDNKFTPQTTHEVASTWLIVPLVGVSMREYGANQLLLQLTKLWKWGKGAKLVRKCVLSINRHRMIRDPENHEKVTKYKGRGISGVALYLQILRSHTRKWDEETCFANWASILTISFLSKGAAPLKSRATFILSLPFEWASLNTGVKLEEASLELVNFRKLASLVISCGSIRHERKK